jgi:hypothetical protein
MNTMNGRSTVNVLAGLDILETTTPVLADASVPFSLIDMYA